MTSTEKYYRILIWFIVFSVMPGFSYPQDSVRISGQLSAWEHFNPSNTFEFWSGGRYIPQINYALDFKQNKKLDFEASVYAFGNLGFSPFDSVSVNGNLKPYRFWTRYSGDQFEIRAGLQKINFGSASILRPLMWFDQVDPRDPLGLTDGVWGVLGRYYFLNNANIWFWTLYGNNDPKGWENIGTYWTAPEFGGRFQFPVPKGEAALTYHRRVADGKDVPNMTMQSEKIPENRIGFDAKLDVIVGVWVEAAWINKKENLGINTNQEIFNAGMDYTFGIGNGLNVIFEQLLASYDEKPFSFENSFAFSLFSLNYPIGMFDNLSAIVYYDWTNNSMYNFINWQKQFNKITLYFMGYINPKNYLIPTQGNGEILYVGSGIQVMLVFNH